MSTQTVLLQLLLGGLLGLVGQGIRLIVGMKKLNDEATAQHTKLAELIVTSKLLMGLLIGFCAGILATVAISDFKAELFGNSATTKQNILAIIAAGYAGTDFIEGLIKKHIPTTTATNNN